MATSNSNNSPRGNLINFPQVDNLSHAYLFYGEAKEEMKREALRLTQILEGKENHDDSKTATLIDATIIDAQDSSSLGIDIVREIKNFLSQKPFISTKRTVVVLGAEELTSEAQNAILKILEDAPKSALIILVASSPERLLPTVISRVQKVYVPKLDDDKSSKKIIQNERATELALRFLQSSSLNRRNLIKEITDEEKDGNTNLTISFVDALILRLSEKPELNASFLKELLYRRRVMGDYSLNKRLQLAFLSNLWYN